MARLFSLDESVSHTNRLAQRSVQLFRAERAFEITEIPMGVPLLVAEAEIIPWGPDLDNASVGNTERYVTTTTLPAISAGTIIPCALTIAGSDPTCGAGIQADLKTFGAHGVYGLSAITAITAQSTVGISAIHPLPHSLLSAQCQGLLRDIAFRHVKIGMLYSREAVQAVTDLVRDNDLVAVLDTPFASKDGTSLLEEDAFDLMRSMLLPLVEVVTPNIPEAERLTGMSITTEAHMTQAAHVLIDAGSRSVLLKGAHLFPGNTRDLFVNADEELWLEGEYIATRHTHGTGCTLSAAIAANLALGRSTIDAVGHAKAYVNQAIAHAIPLGEGHGPLGHFYAMQMQERVGDLLP